MKTVINTLSRIAIVFVAVLTMSFSPATGTPGEKGIPAELKYIGSMNNYPRFQLNLNNSEVEEFVVIIKSKNNEVIYKEKVKGTFISRKYQLNTEEFEASGVTFEVINTQNKNRVAYTVNETSRLVQDVSITAL